MWVPAKVRIQLGKSLCQVVQKENLIKRTSYKGVEQTENQKYDSEATQRLAKAITTPGDDETEKGGGALAGLSRSAGT